MNYIITAAGNGTRFSKEGIKVPKPLIKIKGNELIIWSLLSFDFSPSDKIYIVTLKKDNVKEKLKNKIELFFNISEIHYLELKENLNGQLLSAIETIKYFKIDGPILIHNCDTSYNSKSIKFDSHNEIKNFFGSIPYFQASGEHWSFLKIDNNSNNVIDVKEKIKISNNCSVGSYYFLSSSLLIELFEKYLHSIYSIEAEMYIAPLYDFAIKNNYIVKGIKIDFVKLFGTPIELQRTFNVNKYELFSENSWHAYQRKTYVIDIDGTICETVTNGEYKNAKPKKEFVNALQKAHELGAYIILYTSRNMRTFNGNIGLINKYTSPILQEWLQKNKIPYDELYFGKPWGNSVNYIDDKLIDIQKFIKNQS